MSAVDWYQVKLFVQHATGFSMDGLHVILGVLIQFAAALLLKSSVARWQPLLAVLALALINEASDFYSEIWPDVWIQIAEAVKDVVLTLLLPLIIFLASRNRPALFSLAPKAPAAPAAATATRHESGQGKAE